MNCSDLPQPDIIKTMSMEARFYKKVTNHTVQCLLCPHNCKLEHGHSGICSARRNIRGKLISLTYQSISSMGIDPIEKKPLYHFYPGSQILSIGSIGCNMSCSFCQNANISQCEPKEFSFIQKRSAEQIVQQASGVSNNIGIAFTYNEPVINIEFVLEVASLAKSNRLSTAVISNGYVNPEPLKELINVIDAFNIDLKAFDNNFYRKYTGSLRRPVLDTLRFLAKSNRHLEITNLVIPKLNDDPVRFTLMVKWIRDELGADCPLHISKFYPRHKLQLDQTSETVLYRLYDIAQQHLKYVYIGNIRSEIGQNTFCPLCDNPVISRKGYKTSFIGLKNGTCSRCSLRIIDPKMLN